VLVEGVGIGSHGGGAAPTCWVASAVKYRPRGGEYDAGKARAL
jgi:hypothetical protein